MHGLEEVAALLHIHKEALAHGGALSNIRDGALKRLQTINAEMATPTPTPSTFTPTELDKVAPPIEGEA
jgi:hypothetical protein